MIDSLKHMEEYDPAGAEHAEKRIWTEFAKEAGVSIHRLKLAYRRVVWDGYYGPCSDEQWENIDGEDMPFVAAKEIMSRALGHFPDVRYTHPDHTYEVDTGHGNRELVEEELVVDAEAIRRDLFGEILTIYGGWL